MSLLYTVHSLLCGTQRSQLGITTDKDPSWDMWRHGESYDIKWSNKGPSLSFYHLKWCIDQIYHQTFVRTSQVNIIKHPSTKTFYFKLRFCTEVVNQPALLPNVLQQLFRCLVCLHILLLTPNIGPHQTTAKGINIRNHIYFTMSHVRPQHDSWNEIILEAKGTGHPPSVVANACHVWGTQICGANKHKSRMQIKCIACYQLLSCLSIVCIFARVLFSNDAFRPTVHAACASWPCQTSQASIAQHGPGLLLCKVDSY